MIKYRSLNFLIFSLGLRPFGTDLHPAFEMLDKEMDCYPLFMFFFNWYNFPRV